MAKISINIPESEKLALLKATKKFKGKTVSVATIAREAGLNPNRSRFIMEELIEENRVVKTATKNYNANYIRYTYEVI